MENIFLNAGIISFIYFIIKFIEMRFVEKENKPIKLLFRDTLLVYISVILGFIILNQIKPLMNQIGGDETAPLVFTGNPEF